VDAIDKWKETMWPGEMIRIYSWFTPGYRSWVHLCCNSISWRTWDSWGGEREREGGGGGGEERERGWCLDVASSPINNCCTRTVIHGHVANGIRLGFHLFPPHGGKFIFYLNFWIFIFGFLRRTAFCSFESRLGIFFEWHPRTVS
jgi:hypothetical protein